MFSSVGWGEILILVIVGIIVVGPERLPRIITDVKAMIHAARGAITSAKEELGDDFKEDFEDFRKPLSQINDMRRMGARGLVSKALLDDDPEFFRDIEASARGVSSAVTGQAGSPSEPARPPARRLQRPLGLPGLPRPETPPPPVRRRPTAERTGGPWTRGTSSRTVSLTVAGYYGGSVPGDAEVQRASCQRLTAGDQLVGQRAESDAGR